MIVLLIVTIALTAVVAFMIFKIVAYRKQQAEFSQLPQSAEMIEGNRF
jgi:Flp pilus assembly protein TadB